MPASRSTAASRRATSQSGPPSARAASGLNSRTAFLGRGPALAGRAFHAELDEAGELDRVLHRERLHDRLDEAVDDHGGRLLLGEPTAAQIEELVVADLRDRGLVADARVLLLDLHVRVGVAARLLVEDQRVAPDVTLHVVRTLFDLDQPPVRRA